MAEPNGDAPKKEQAPDDRVMDLLRRSSAGTPTAAQASVRSGSAHGGKPKGDATAAPVPDAQPAVTSDDADNGEAKKEAPVVIATPPELIQEETDDEDAEKRRAAGIAVATLSESAPAVTPDPARRRWRWVVGVLLLLLLCTAGLFLLLREKDDHQTAENAAIDADVGPHISVGGQSPAQPEPKSGSDLDPADRAARLELTPSIVGKPLLADSERRQPDVAEPRITPPDAPVPREPAFLPPKLRDGEGTPPAVPQNDAPGETVRGSRSTAAGAGGAAPATAGRSASAVGSGGASAMAGSAGAGTPPAGPRPRTATAAAVPPLSPRERSARLLDPAVPDACPETPKDRVVLVFDGSVSMGLPLDIPVDLEAALDQRMAAGDNEARLEYRRLLATDKPKRLDYGKSAVRTLLRDADQQLDFGAVAFTACNEIATRPFAAYQGRSQLGDFIGAVTPHRGGNTALVASIQAALDLLLEGGPDGRIIVLTDGQETCDGDLCALAEQTGKAHPGVRIDVIDLSGLSRASCIAEATGGVMLTYAETHNLMPLSRLLVRAANQCTPGDIRRSSP